MANRGKVFNDAVTSAKKSLGKEGELPKQRVNLAQTIDELNKVHDVFDKQRGDLEKTIVDAETGAAKLKAVAKQYSDVIDGNDFGLDAKDPKNKKIIAEVTKTMLDALQGIEDFADEASDRLDKLDKLDKVLTNLSRLK